MDISKRLGYAQPFFMPATLRVFNIFRYNPSMSKKDKLIKEIDILRESWLFLDF
jgi:hypothetical protein